MYVIEAPLNTYQIRTTTVGIVIIHLLVYGLSAFQRVSPAHIRLIKCSMVPELASGPRLNWEIQTMKSSIVQLSSLGHN